MKKLATYLALLSTTLMIASTANAGSYAIGTTYDGCVYNGVDWTYTDGTHWQLTLVPTCYNGCNTTYRKWTYVGAATYRRPATRAKLDRTEVIKQFTNLALKKAEFEYNFASDRADDQLVKDLHQSLGLARPNGTVPYGSNYYGAIYSGSYSIAGSAVVPSQTIYGASVQSFKSQVQLSGDPALDLNGLALIQQQLQVGSDAANSKRAAFTNDTLSKMAQSEQQRQQAKVDYEAKLIAIKAIMNGTPTATVTTQTQTTTPVMPSIVDPQPKQAPDTKPVAQPRQDLAALETYLSSNCAVCHGAAKQAANLDLRLYPQLSDEMKDKIFERISLPPTDPKFMPRDAADPTKPGTPATRAQRKLLAIH